jgi:hypothetical protein
MGHIDLFTKYRPLIHRIAVAHRIPSVGFAVATVALASQTNIKGFGDRSTALSWLGTERALG